VRRGASVSIVPKSTNAKRHPGTSQDLFVRRLLFFGFKVPPLTPDYA
jgi:hypothetical protein